MSDIFGTGISAAVGTLIGVGVAWGSLRTRVVAMKTEINEIKTKQDTLRGAPIGMPLFVFRTECDLQRQKCQEHVCDEIHDMGEKLKAVENYVRWEMGQKGLPPDQINRILEESHQHA